MSAVWLQLISVLCLSCTALSGPESGGVVWRDLGGVVTIQCRTPEADQEFLTLKKGLNEDHILVKENNSDSNLNIAKEFKGRLQLNGVFGSVDILIKNLTSDDTGPYWCLYSKFDGRAKVIEKQGTGSVLLVVTDMENQCDPVNKKLVLVPVVISAAVLLVIITWIILKTKALRSTVIPRRVTTNDVYEDMRGTLRR